MVLFSVAKVEFFFFLSYSRFLSLQLDLASLLERGRGGVLLSANFIFLGLDFSERGYLVVVL